MLVEDMCKKLRPIHGLKVDRLWQAYSIENNNGKREIEQMIHEGYQRFFIRPDYIVKELVRIGTSSYRLDVLLSNLKRANTVAESVKLVT